MKSEYCLEDIIEWDINNWSSAIEYWHMHRHSEWSSMKAIEIGSRHGGLSLWAALNGMDVLCTDLKGPSNEARFSENGFSDS